MADETLANGANTNLDDSYTAVPPSKSDDSEKSRLLRENQDSKQQIESLLAEIEALKADGAEAKSLLEEKLKESQRDSEQSKDDQRALHSISSRAADLETEVSRLQHDLISVVSENEDLGKEIAGLKEELERKVEVIGSLRMEKEQYGRENALLHEKVKKSEANAEELRQATSNGGGDDVGVVERSGSAAEGWKAVKLPGTALVAAGTVIAVAAVAYIAYSRRN